MKKAVLRFTYSAYLTLITILTPTSFHILISVLA
jgi:hypothetical protein